MGFPRKDSQARDSMSSEATEYSKSGIDVMEELMKMLPLIRASRILRRRKTKLAKGYVPVLIWCLYDSHLRSL